MTNTSALIHPSASKTNSKRSSVRRAEYIYRNMGLDGAVFADIAAPVEAAKHSCAQATFVFGYQDKFRVTGEDGR